MSAEPLLAGFTGLVARELQLCAVTPEQTVVVYHDGLGRPALVEAFLAAAQIVGATVIEMKMPPRMAPSDERASWWSEAPAALARAFRGADLVVDVSGGGLFHAGQAEILGTGTRILRVREPARRLEAMLPRPDVVARVKASAALLAAATEVRITTPAGGDLAVRTAGQPVTAQYGYTDTPGRWDHWGTALAALAGAEGEGNGTYVLAPGDVVFFSATVGRYLREPLAVTFVDGAVTTITGGVEAQMLNHLLDRADGADARRLSHLGWGCDPRADWNALELLRAEGGGGADLRSIDGGITLAFGANLDLGGTSDSTVHVDLAVRGGSFALDGEVVLRDHVYLVDGLRDPA